MSIGWYVHHAGAGHLTRFLAVRPQLDAEVVVFSSLPEPRVLPARTRWMPLPRDDDDEARPDGTVRRPADSDPTVGGMLHWAPLRHSGHTRRLAAIATVAAETGLGAMVVDVSAEVALFVRLLGVPLVLMAQPGDRDDEAHALAYGAADAIVAPWPASAHDDPRSLLARMGSKVHHVGGISRFDGRGAAPAGDPGTVLVLGGGASGAELTARMSAAAAATPGTSWRLIGGPAGWTDDPWSALCEAEVVVSAAGQNSIADLAAAGARAVVVPEPRPFAEQAATAEALHRDGLAVVEHEWPEPEAWPALLDAARALTPAWQAWGVDGAAARAASVIEAVVERHR